jgi:uncharacterized membrane-anchored protein
MSRKLLIGLAAAILFQITVLVGMYVNAAMPEWTGTEIRIKTVPVDPRSMFRGNYARLRYEISRIQSPDLGGNEEMRKGEVIYVSLSESVDGLYQYASASLVAPADGIFLRGRVFDQDYESEVIYYRVKYGVEAYFAPKDKALQLEKDLRDGGVAVLMVADSGRARLTNVVGQ